jgi:DNA-binding SARP family transcriptional activator/DNA-binding XRE family transcriptional regulator
MTAMETPNPGPVPDMPYAQDVPVGVRIHAFRKRVGMSQRDLAALARMSTRALRDIENGHVQRPHAGTVRRLTAALGLTEQETDEVQAAAREPRLRAISRPSYLILGSLSLQRGEGPVPIARPMLRRLLGLLVLRHPEPVTQREIIDVLWPTDPPKSAHNLIHTYVSQLRQLLEDRAEPTGTGQVLERLPGGYALRIEPNQIDLGRFDEYLARAVAAHEAGQYQVAIDAVALALQCWRGPILADTDPLLSQHPTAVAATGRRVKAALLYADLGLLLRRPERAIRTLWDIAADEPLHEGLHARLILTLAGCGEQAAALNVFTGLRNRLDE